MDGIRAYLLSVTAAALLCALVRALTEHAGSGAGLIRLLSGVFLCFTVIQPVTQIRLDNWTELPDRLLDQGTAAAAAGEDYSRDALQELIKQRTQAYIQDIAGQYDAVLDVTVTVSGDDPPVPHSVRLEGKVSPYVRQQLTEVLTRELGIREENQLWTQ